MRGKGTFHKNDSHPLGSFRPDNRDPAASRKPDQTSIFAQPQPARWRSAPACIHWPGATLPAGGSGRCSRRWGKTFPGCRSRDGGPLDYQPSITFRSVDWKYLPVACAIGEIPLAFVAEGLGRITNRNVRRFFKRDFVRRNSSRKCSALKQTANRGSPTGADRREGDKRGGFSLSPSKNSGKSGRECPVARSRFEDRKEKRGSSVSVADARPTSRGPDDRRP